MKKEGVESAAEWISVDQLKPWTKNPRKDQAVKAVAESIKRFGFAAPIVARKADGEIIAGHTRYAAALALGLPKVPVRFVDLDPVNAHLLAISDNRTAELSNWDIDLFKGAFEEFSDVVGGIPGFTEKDLDLLLGEPDEMDPKPEKLDFDVSGVPFSFGSMSAMVSQSTFDAFEEAVSKKGSVENVLVALCNR